MLLVKFEVFFFLVFVSPPTVVYSGATTGFECLSLSQLTIQSIVWRINGSQFNDSTFNDIQQALLRREGSNVIRGSSLTISNTPVAYNTTNLQCSVEFTTGSRETSDTTSLLVQG